LQYSNFAKTYSLLWFIGYAKIRIQFAMENPRNVRGDFGIVESLSLVY